MNKRDYIHARWLLTRALWARHCYQDKESRLEMARAIRVAIKESPDGETT